MKFVLLIVAAISAAACRSPSPPPPPPQEVVIWKEVGSWSGRGNAQTETFTSDTGGFRVR